MYLYNSKRPVLRGFFSETYLGLMRDPLHQKVEEIALKRLSPTKELLEKYSIEILTKMFEREADIHLKLKHQNIIEAYEMIAPKDGMLQLATAFSDGGSLSDRISFYSNQRSQNEHNACFPAIELIATLYDIASALAYLHGSAGEFPIIHCDIQPKNILYSDNQAKLIDFGLAFRATMFDEKAGYGGKPLFFPTKAAAPERSDFVNCSYDIWALGYSLLTALNLSEPEFGGADYSLGSRQEIESIIDGYFSKADGDTGRIGNLRDQFLRLIQKMVCTRQNRIPNGQALAIQLEGEKNDKNELSEILRVCVDTARAFRAAKQTYIGGRTLYLKGEIKPIQFRELLMAVAVRTRALISARAVPWLSQACHADTYYSFEADMHLQIATLDMQYHADFKSTDGRKLLTEYNAIESILNTSFSVLNRNSSFPISRKTYSLLAKLYIKWVGMRRKLIGFAIDEEGNVQKQTSQVGEILEFCATLIPDTIHKLLIAAKGLMKSYEQYPDLSAIFLIFDIYELKKTIDQIVQIKLIAANGIVEKAIRDTSENVISELRELETFLTQMRAALQKDLVQAILLNDDYLECSWH
jgi:serine/threonine protein kinase